MYCDATKFSAEENQWMSEIQQFDHLLDQFQLDDSELQQLFYQKQGITEKANQIFDSFKPIFGAIMFQYPNITVYSKLSPSEDGQKGKYSKEVNLFIATFFIGKSVCSIETAKLKRLTFHDKFVGAEIEACTPESIGTKFSQFFDQVFFQSINPDLQALHLDSNLNPESFFYS